MATRFGRKTSEGTMEYYDSKEELDKAESAERHLAISGLGGLVGFILGGYLCFMAITAYVPEWYKAVRFGLILLSAVIGAAILAFTANFLVSLFFMVIGGTVLYYLVKWLWTSL